MLVCSADYLNTAFVPGCFPRLRYIAKQELHPSSLIRPMHSHEEVSEILLIYKGTGVYRSGVYSYTVKGGDLIFSNPKIAHEMTSSLVATMVGYDNTNYFNTVFTKMVGLSPTRYRTQYMTELHGICKQ